MAFSTASWRRMRHLRRKKAALPSLPLRCSTRLTGEIARRAERTYRCLIRNADLAIGHGACEAACVQLARGVEPSTLNVVACVDRFAPEKSCLTSGSRGTIPRIKRPKNRWRCLRARSIRRCLGHRSVCRRDVKTFDGTNGRPLPASNKDRGSSARSSRHLSLMGDGAQPRGKFYPAIRIE